MAPPPRSDGSPSGMVATTTPFVLSTRETVRSSWLTTQTESRSTARYPGEAPTAMRSVGASELWSSRTTAPGDVVPSVAQISPSSDATPLSPESSWTTWLVAGSMTMNDPTPQVDCHTASATTVTPSPQDS